MTERGVTRNFSRYEDIAIVYTLNIRKLSGYFLVSTFVRVGFSPNIDTAAEPPRRAEIEPVFLSLQARKKVRQ